MTVKLQQRPLRKFSKNRGKALNLKLCAAERKDLIMVYFTLVLGFFLLIKGADFFVDGSGDIAKKMKIPPVIIGLTIVSIGTSLPEASVSITAAMNGSNALALSNVTGSNIFNLMVVAGLCAVIKPIKTNMSILVRDFPIAVMSSIAVIIFILDRNISRIEGLMLLIGCVVYILALIWESMNSKDEDTTTEEKKISVIKCIGLIIVGVAGIIFGGDLVVDSAVSIAYTFGLSENLVGLTIVAVGTSLPELVTSLVAAKKGESELAMGNALGSCIFNILFILGLSAFVTPIAVGLDSISPTIVMTLSTILMYIFSATSKKATRLEGIITLTLYAIYMTYLVIGGDRVMEIVNGLIG